MEKYQIQRKTASGTENICIKNIVGGTSSSSATNLYDLSTGDYIWKVGTYIKIEYGSLLYGTYNNNVGDLHLTINYRNPNSSSRFLVIDGFFYIDEASAYTMSFTDSLCSTTINLSTYAFEERVSHVVYGTGADTGATSIETTGNGNAVSSASYDSTTRKITLTKGITALTSSDISNTVVHDDSSAVSESTLLDNYYTKTQSDSRFAGASDLRDFIQYYEVTDRSIGGQGSSVSVTASIPSGYKFLCWLQPATVGWVGSVYAEHQYSVTSNFWNAYGGGG